MKPIDFKNSNVVYAKDQPEYLSLPAHRTEDGKVTTCWELSLVDRIRALIYGRIYLQTLTFNNPLQPVRLDTELKCEN